MSNFLTHGVSIILLLALNCSNSLLVCGVSIDGKESDGTCIDFAESQQNYLSVIFNKDQEPIEPNTKPLLDEPSVKVVIV